MTFQTKYITPSDFRGYTGIDLTEMLPDHDANAFIFRIETRLSAYLDARLFRNVDKEFPTFTDNQKEHYKLALLEQALYVFQNGDLSVDSGYDPETGEKISRNNLDKLTIGQNAIDHLMLAGLWTFKLGNYPYGRN